MPDPTVVRIILIAIAIAAIVLRVAAFRGPGRRGSTTVATLVLFAILALSLGLFAWSVVGAYVDRLPHD